MPLITHVSSYSTINSHSALQGNKMHLGIWDSILLLLESMAKIPLTTVWQDQALGLKAESLQDWHKDPIGAYWHIGKSC